MGYVLLQALPTPNTKAMQWWRICRVITGETSLSGPSGWENMRRGNICNIRVVAEQEGVQRRRVRRRRKEQGAMARTEGGMKQKDQE